MSLPSESSLSTTVQAMVKGLPAPGDSDAAIKNFSDGISKIILDVIKAGSVTVDIPMTTVLVAATGGVPNSTPITL